MNLKGFDVKIGITIIKKLQYPPYLSYAILKRMKDKGVTTLWQQLNQLETRMN